MEIIPVYLAALIISNVWLASVIENKIVKIAFGLMWLVLAIFMTLHQP